MLSKIYKIDIPAVFVVIFLAWLSFAPEVLQAAYLPAVRYLLPAVLFLSLLRRGFKISEYFFKKEDRGIWVYFILVSAGLANAPDKNAAISYYKDLIILGGSIYFLTKHVINKESCKIILRYLVIFSFVVSIIGIAEMICARNIIYEKFIDNYFYERLLGHKRMMSTLMNSNITGSYLLACAPLAYYFYYNAKNTAERNIYFFIFTALTASVLLTFSRGSWIAGLLTLSVYMIWRNSKRALFAIWGGFTIFLILASFLPDSYFKYRFSMPSLATYIARGHRTAQYFTTANMLKKHPLAGVGLNNYRKVFDLFSDRELYEEVKIPDSIYLMHLAEAGIIGFSGFFVFLSGVIKRAIAALKNNRSKRTPFLFVSLSFAALLFNMASFDGFLWRTPFYLFWFLAAAVNSLANRGNSS